VFKVNEQANEIDIRKSARDEEFDKVLANMEARRWKSLEDVLTGATSELDAFDFWQLVEVDTPVAQGDHQRLCVTAELAIQYWRKNPEGHSQSKLIRKVAIACHVDPTQLDHYISVLQNDKNYRNRTGSPPLENLPTLVEEVKLVEKAKLEPPAAVEPLALPMGTPPDDDLWEYVELAEQGYNNTQIGKMAGRNESTVRRKLAKAGYQRAA
jgi:hypothetical protein